MPNGMNIDAYVTALLADDLKVAPQPDPIFSFGYSNQSQTYENPHNSNKRVVLATSGYDEKGKLKTGHPNCVEEGKKFINGVAAAAIALVDQDFSISATDKQARKEQIQNYAKKFILNTEAIGKKGTPEGNLFESKSSDHNKAYAKTFKKVKKELKLFANAVAEVSQKTLKEIDHQGHVNRSRNRPTLVHKFRNPRSAEGDELFIIYIPCGRYTDNQRRLMGVENREHDTTSHNRGNMILGNSSMARVISGTRSKDGQVTIVHDSFTGPGARMPYEDFKKADANKRLAIKAATLLNQEEIIQNSAERYIERLSDEQLLADIKNKPAEGVAAGRQKLIEMYLQDNPLNICECYSQVVSAGQPVIAASENQYEQFAYVRQMMDVFNGAEVDVSIPTGPNSEAKGTVLFQSRMSSWGVNAFRKGGILNLDAVAGNQNTRFINQMTDDVGLHLSNAPEMFNPLRQLMQGPDVSEINNQIQAMEFGLKFAKTVYRDKMVAFYAIHKSGDKNQMALLRPQIEALETQIKAEEDKIYALHKAVEVERKQYFLQHKDEIQQALEQLREQANTPQLKHYFNICAHLIHAQELYYENTWHLANNNFKLQALTATLAVELDYANTKGCKSNNDRGPRLLQKILGNALYTEMCGGLYDRKFLDTARTHEEQVCEVEQLDRELTLMQAQHHTANTGVSGGKFGVDSRGFADNGLWGDVAGLAKLPEMESHYFYDNLGFKTGTSILVGAVLALVLTLTGVGAAVVIAAAVTATAVTFMAESEYNYFDNSKAVQKVVDQPGEVAETALEISSYGAMAKQGLVTDLDVRAQAQTQAQSEQAATAQQESAPAAVADSAPVSSDNPEPPRL